LRDGVAKCEIKLVAKQRSIVLTDPQDSWLSAEAVRLGITVSDVIRRLIDEFRSADEHRRKIGNGLRPAAAFPNA
jgi:hypothetical protein